MQPAVSFVSEPLFDSSAPLPLGFGNLWCRVTWNNFLITILGVMYYLVSTPTLCSWLTFPWLSRDKVFLVLTWTVVTHVGGCVSMQQHKDFWCLAFLTLVQTAGWSHKIRKAHGESELCTVSRWCC